MGGESDAQLVNSVYVDNHSMELYQGEAFRNTTYYYYYYYFYYYYYYYYYDNILLVYKYCNSRITYLYLYVNLKKNQIKSNDMKFINYLSIIYQLTKLITLCEKNLNIMSLLCDLGRLDKTKGAIALR
jgi:hypothetical protein